MPSGRAVCVEFAGESAPGAVFKEGGVGALALYLYAEGGVLADFYYELAAADGRRSLACEV